MLKGCQTTKNLWLINPPHLTTMCIHMLSTLTVGTTWYEIWDQAVWNKGSNTLNIVWLNVHNPFAAPAMPRRFGCEVPSIFVTKILLRICIHTPADTTDEFLLCSTVLGCHDVMVVVAASQILCWMISCRRHWQRLWSITPARLTNQPAGQFRPPAKPMDRLNVTSSLAENLEM